MRETIFPPSTPAALAALPKHIQERWDTWRGPIEELGESTPDAPTLPPTFKLEELGEAETVPPTVREDDEILGRRLSDRELQICEQAMTAPDPKPKRSWTK